MSMLISFRKALSFSGWKIPGLSYHGRSTHFEAHLFVSTNGAICVQNYDWQDNSRYPGDRYKLGELRINNDLAKSWALPFTFCDSRIWNLDLGVGTVGELKNFSGYFKYSIFNLQSSII